MEPTPEAPTPAAPNPASPAPGAPTAAVKFGSALVDAVAGPTKPWPWAHRLPQRPLRLILVISAVAVLFVGGYFQAMGQLLALGMPALAAWLFALAYPWPFLFFFVAPLWSWRLQAAAMTVSVFALMPQDRLWPWPITSCIFLAVFIFLVAMVHSRSTIVGVISITMVMFALAVLSGATPVWIVIIQWTGVLIAAWLGWVLRTRGDAVRGLAEQTRLREADQAESAVLAERARIARELHDVVAHHMSMIAIQAEAAPIKMPELSPQARQSFATIHDAAREALTEMRRVVGLLRTERDGADRAPSPTIAELETPIEAARASGLTVDYRIDGIPRPVGTAIDLSVYRIVQEALANASRYAPGTRVEIALRYAGQRLDLTIVDDGPHNPVEPRSAAISGGHGLVGMRERVAMLGGTFAAGPAVGGGFQITAQLPLTSVADKVEV